MKWFMMENLMKNEKIEIWMNYDFINNKNKKKIKLNKLKFEFIEKIEEDEIKWIWNLMLIKKIKNDKIAWI